MEAGYRLVTYDGSGGAPTAGVLTNDRVYPAGALLGESSLTVLDILKRWGDLHPRLAKAAAGISPSSGIALADVSLLAPIQYPGVLFCAGANYWDHLAEMGELVKKMTGSAPSMVKAAEPWFFIKTTAGTIVGDGARVRLPSFSEKVDWEAELGVVIGWPTRHISEADAFQCVAGYVIVNDLSARDLVKREGSPFIYDWIGQKCWDGAGPMGPWLTPAAYVKDPNNLAIRLSVNGVTKQSSNTAQMVHGIAEQIAYLSRHVTLQPGDVIATGTPSGVGMPRGEFLKVGDEVRVEIEGLGVLTNTMVADDAPAWVPQETVDG
jgi:2-keto-4-pentenoate hydratase/2-oxohepta-3-ene-1,7-dioic acid hydratase in catechol pathway